jgi:hypothetical protein
MLSLTLQQSIYISLVPFVFISHYETEDLVSHIFSIIVRLCVSFNLVFMGYGAVWFGIKVSALYRSLFRIECYVNSCEKRNRLEITGELGGGWRPRS